MKSRTAHPVAKKPLETHLGYWLRLVSNHVSKNFASALQDKQLSVAEWVALNHIDDATDITAAHLADAMSMTRGAVSKVLDKLAEKRWIVRAIDPRDNRAQLLSLTTPGRRVLPQLRAIADGNDAHFFAGLGAAESNELRRLLKKLAHVHSISAVPID